MTWRPEWAYLDQATMARIQQLNHVDSIALSWMNRPDERSLAVEMLGDLMYELHPDDRVVCERLFERASVGLADAFQSAYLELGDHMKRIATEPTDGVQDDSDWIEIQDVKHIAGSAESRGTWAEDPAQVGFRREQTKPGVRSYRYFVRRDWIHRFVKKNHVNL